MTIRVDHVEQVYDVARMLSESDSSLRLSFVTQEYADETRDWTEPVRFRIIDDESHPGMVVVEFKTAKDAA